MLSGKGGVGKSTFTAGLSWALAADEDVQVSLLECRDKRAISHNRPVSWTSTSADRLSHY